MDNHPFSLLRPYADRLDVLFFIKDSAIASDDQLKIACATERIVSVNQVHGNKTVIADGPMQREWQADGLITNQNDLLLSIRIADCQAFAAYDPQMHVLGVLHAGWRGLLAGAIPQFFSVMRHEWGCDPAALLVAAAPSLCQACAEFTDPRTELPGIDPRFFDRRTVDLRGIADAQLHEAGVTAAHLERHPDCTRCRSGRYWSYRGGDREQVKMEGMRNVLACRLRRA